MDTLLVYRRENIYEARVIGGEAMAAYRLRAGLFSLSSQACISYANTENISKDEILPYNPGMTLSVKLHPSFKLGQKAVLSAFVGLKAVSGRQIWDYKKDAVTDLEDYQDFEAGIALSFLDRYEAYLRSTNMLSQEIQSYEDALMILEGKPMLEGGFKITVF